MSTVIPGATAVITMPGHAGQEFFQVALNVGAALLPVPSFGHGWEKFIKGLKRLSGTITAHIAKEAAGTNPFADGDGQMTILFDTGCSITFGAIIGDRTIGTDAAGSGVVTFSFAKNDELEPVITWDEATEP